MFAPSWGIALEKEHAHGLFSMPVATERKETRINHRRRSVHIWGVWGKSIREFFVMCLQRVLWKSEIILKRIFFFF